MSERRVVVLSLEPWDGIWRRNQHLASRLIARKHALHVDFVCPPSRTPRASEAAMPGVTLHYPSLKVPKRFGGMTLTAQGLRGLVRGCDALWVNDPVLGARVRTQARRVYDVTDDWRTAAVTERELRRLIAAEDALTTQSNVVVCSAELRQRWQTRYGVEAALVPNGVDLAAVAAASPDVPIGPGPHIGYIGTLHAERLDLDLVRGLADLPEVGTVHLIGPNHLPEDVTHELSRHAKISLGQPLPFEQVPARMKGMDVLVCPHRVTDFTLSLDAIKAQEYLATGRPVVATPTSGFQDLAAPGLWLETAGFLDAVTQALTSKENWGARGAVDWDERTDAFASVLFGTGP